MKTKSFIFFFFLGVSDFSFFNVPIVVTILIENSQTKEGGRNKLLTKKENEKSSCHNIPKSFGLTISNTLQFLSQLEELHVKLNILIANFFNSG